MTQEDKNILVKDLCARLPYGTIVRNYATNEDDVLTYSLLEDFEIVGLESIKPYLRPISSMTDEELFNYKHLDLLNYSNDGFEMSNFHSIDWLNKHHFDYRGLIEKSLAIIAPEGMYKTE